MGVDRERKGGNCDVISRPEKSRSVCWVPENTAKTPPSGGSVQAPCLVSFMSMRSAVCGGSSLPCHEQTVSTWTATSLLLSYGLVHLPLVEHRVDLDATALGSQNVPRSKLNKRAYRKTSCQLGSRGPRSSTCDVERVCVPCPSSPTLSRSICGSKINVSFPLFFCPFFPFPGGSYLV